LPELKLKIDAETDVVQKERLKILYVLWWKAYNVYYKKLQNVFQNRF
jgi:hypothetical protein